MVPAELLAAEQALADLLAQDVSPGEDMAGAIADAERAFLNLRIQHLQHHGTALQAQSAQLLDHGQGVMTRAAAATADLRAYQRAAHQLSAEIETTRHEMNAAVGRLVELVASIDARALARGG